MRIFFFLIEVLYIFLEYYLYMKNYTMTDFILLAKPPASTTVYTVNHLQAGTRYKFKVAAANQFGTGDTSAETQWIETLTLGMW